MRAWAEVDLEAVWQNVGVIKEEIGRDVDLIAVVKADAYGHGINAVVRTIDPGPVAMYAVLSLEEARTIRRQSTKPILIMGYLDIKEVVDAIEEGFDLSVYDKDLLAVYERFAARLNRVVKIHLKVETGLNRLGITFNEASEYTMNQHMFPHLSMQAVFSHLAMAGDVEASTKQLRVLQKLVVAVGGKVPVFPMHLASSYSLGVFKAGYLDAVRTGLAMYGVDSVLPNLKPSFACKSIVMQVKTVPAGEGVSYGHLFTATKGTKIAVVAIGYAEGLSQIFRDKMEVVIQGRKLPVIGQLCMNHIIVDTKDVDVRRGDEVVIIGSQQGRNGDTAGIQVAELAKLAGIRHHEIVTRLGHGLPRRYHEIKPTI